MLFSKNKEINTYTSLAGRFLPSTILKYKDVFLVIFMKYELFFQFRICCHASSYKRRPAVLRPPHTHHLSCPPAARITGAQSSQSRGFSRF